ncbi:MAG: AAA family ATPase, partial [Candidatus Cloacimonetes bacterium]|nr:AAA family ATPase [Candidatus Cloacimonadota bacterium]
FKDCKERSFREQVIKIKQVLSQTALQAPSLNGSSLSPIDQDMISKTQNMLLEPAELSIALQLLSKHYKNVYQTQPLILIDEYDVPLQSAWTGGYWDEAVTFFRNFFSAGFKDNPNLWRAVITGCLRVARESMFTGMNNLMVSSVSSKKFSTHFGFTVPEVKQLIQDYNLTAIETQIESWYNGYIFGETEIYNPWSILNLCNNDGEFQPYWMNTSGNDLVKEILGRSGVDAKKDLEDLMAGQSIQVSLQEQVVFQEIENTRANLWNFLYFTGYLKAINIKHSDEVTLIDLKIPNVEVKRIFYESVQYWFAQSKSLSLLQNLKRSLIEGEVTEISKILRRLCDYSISYFDVSGKEPEKFYHGLVLGLIVSFSDIWHIRSNRESGLGRCDLLMSPKNPNHFGIVMEFKTMDSYEDADLSACAQNAMDQINKRQYEKELMAQGATKILKMGIGFLGKQLEILSEHLQC